MLWAASKDTRERTVLNASALFGALEPAQAEDVLRQLLAAKPGGIVGLIGARDDPWSAEFSRFVVHRLATLFEQDHYGVLALIGEATGYLDPSVLRDVELLLQAHPDSELGPSLERLVRILDYRGAMRAELDP